MTVDPPVDLSVVVCTYNCAPFISECLAAIPAAIADLTVEVLVADNDSTDGTVATIAGSFPDVAVIEMGANTGFSRANNAALAKASGRHAVLLNPDTVASPGSLAALVQFLDAHPRAGVVAPRLLYADGTDQGTARSFPTPAAALFGRRSPLTKLFPDNRWSARYLSGRDAVRSGEPFEVDWVSGACLMAPRAVIDEVGPLDEGFFMHWEDADWCHRVKDAGYGVWCVPTSEVVHLEGAARRGWPPAQVRWFHHGAYRYWSKHHGTKGWRKALRPIVAGALGGRAAMVIARDKLLHRA